MEDIKNLDSLLIQALKAKDEVRVNTLRGLKTRLKNEQIAKGESLSEADIFGFVRSEIKRRLEAESSFTEAGRTEMAEKERLEAQILQVFLPPAPDLNKVQAEIQAYIADQKATAQDFGRVMAHFKKVYGASLDGAELARIVKTTLV